jgi:Rrf2 family iron-sulfur cluster assembly transcriptional regulator
MKLTAKGHYAIKAMINIALSTSNEPKTLLEISKHQGISLSYLEQLFSLLRKSNLVAGVRGPGGGYRLSTDPENITIAQIINAINRNYEHNLPSEKKDEVVWEKFSDRLCKYLETVTLGSLIDGEEINNITEDSSKREPSTAYRF